MLNKCKEDGYLYNHNIPLEKSLEIQFKSKSILDINHKNRTGITLHVISALANGIKVITTNESIKKELFYNENNIYVLDVDNPVVDKEFFEKPFVSMNFEHLRLDNWLVNVLCV